MNQLLKFFKLTGKHKLLVVETTIALTIAKIALYALPFKYLAPLLGKKNKESDNGLSKSFMVKAMTFLKAIFIVNKNLPWKSQCFPQAIAGCLMLKMHKVPRTLYLGVKKENDCLKAHAWVRSGNYIVTGNGILDEYSVVFYLS